jgi:glutaconate CoA-transferase, subunit A
VEAAPGWSVEMPTSFLELPAAAELIADGDRLGVGGALFSRLPLTLVAELARRERRDLTYVTWGGGLPLELLLQAEAVRRVVFCFSSFDVFGLAPRFRRALEEDEVEVEELPALAMAQGFDAARQRLPSLPFQLPVGSDILQRSSLTRVSPDPVAAVQIGSAAALHLDSYLLHAQRADRAGNVELTGALGMDLTAPFAARNLVVSVEEIVPTGTLERDRRGHVIPHHFVRAIVECPFGAYPTSCLPYYTADYRALAAAFDAEPLAVPSPTPERRRLVESAAAAEPEVLSRHRFPRVAPSAPTAADVMAVCLAREYGDESVCSAGAVSPLAMTSYLLARRTHAPGLTLITTSGGYVDVEPRPMLLGLGEALDYKTAIAYATGDETYHRYYQSGKISHEVVATAQVDRFGAANTIEVRSPSGRVIRLPGQGGMADVANLHQHFVLYVTRHSPLSLVDRVDVSSAARGLLTDEERLESGLRPGVVKVVTNLCVFELDHASRELRLVSLHPGVELAEVERETGFEVVPSSSLERTTPPSSEELELLATEIDPLGIRHLELVPARERGAFLAEIIAAEERLVAELVPG